MNTFHITVGTYGTRLHGGAAPTVQRKKNVYGEEFVPSDPGVEKFVRDRMVRNPVYFTNEQKLFLESKAPEICEQGRWKYHLLASQGDHFHLLLSGDADPKKIRRWFKHWTTQRLNDRFGKRIWFAECGSTKWIFDDDYFRNVYEYIRKQRATPE